MSGRVGGASGRAKRNGDGLVMAAARRSIARTQTRRRGHAWRRRSAGQASSGGGGAYRPRRRRKDNRLLDVVFFGFSRAYGVVINSPRTFLHASYNTHGKYLKGNRNIKIANINVHVFYPLKCDVMCRISCKVAVERTKCTVRRPVGRWPSRRMPYLEKEGGEE